jgi:hypothetical protein
MTGTQTSNGEAARGTAFQGLRFLDPATTHVHLGTRGALHVTIAGDRIYPGVFAMLAFPESAGRGRYVSLRYLNEEGHEEEIGMIRRLDAFDEKARRLVEESLGKRYFIHEIKSIRSIQFRFGFLEFDVDTDKGPRTFSMRWRRDRAYDHGRDGKVLVDAAENRYRISSVSELPRSQAQLLLRYIYW